MTVMIQWNQREFMKEQADEINGRDTVAVVGWAPAAPLSRL